MERKLTIITGANGQVGSFLARIYSESRTPLLLLYHKKTDRIIDLDKLHGVTLKSCDLCDADQVKQVIDCASRDNSAVPAYLIHTAAVRSSDAKSVAEGDPDTFANVFRQNLMGAYNILRYTLPAMREKKFGRIVLFGSNVVNTGLANGAAYASAKAAIVNLCRSAALENAANGILINCISPAPVDTKLEEDYQGEYLAFRRRYFEKALKLSPTGKLVSKEEIRVVTDLLLSDSLINLNGENIILDGGFSAQIS